MDSRCKSVLFIAAIIVAMVVTAMISGCGQQIDASFGVGWRSLYPNKAGDRIGTIGDPRTEMYGGSGYVERHSSGGESGIAGFRGMETGGDR